MKDEIQKIKSSDEHIYFNCRREWDDRMGSALVRAKNWRFMAFISVIFALLMGVGFIFYARQPKLIPYIVQIEPDGTVSTPEDVRMQRYQPSEAVINSQLVRFIELSRSLSSDVAMVQENTTTAFAYTGERANTQLISHLDELSKHVGVQTRTIRPSTILNYSENVKQVEWVEIIRDENGKVISSEEWRGLFTYFINSEVIRDEILLINPVGFFVIDFDWSERNAL